MRQLGQLAPYELEAARDRTRRLDRRSHRSCRALERHLHGESAGGEDSGGGREVGAEVRDGTTFAW